MDLPARIGKYELQEFLGGGMSHVYRALDTVIGRTVAVKILTEQGCQDIEAKARFLAEARMAGNIAHDNVLSIYDFGEDEYHRPFMVMEFLRGEDLRHAINGGRTGDLKSKLKIALQIGRALEYIHTQRIIHRDIKPENVHINSAGVVKLMDFGIAKTEGLAMTRAGYVLGTPYYMAPEQVMGSEVTDQVDVYAFGVLLFELLAGAKPFGGDSVERIFYAILNEPVNLDPLVQARIPQAIIDLVAGCTAKQAAQRPQGFAPICAELERALATQDAPTIVMQPTIVAAPPAERPVWLMPVILVVVAALAAALYFALQKPKVITVVQEPSKGPEFAATLSFPSGDMVLVKAGSFQFGKDKKATFLPAYYVDKTEVSNAAYAAFCKENGHKLPQDFPANKPDLPVVNVSILDAKAFANWAGKRLPNAKEWEKAARGADGFAFPWGNDADHSRANLGHENATQPDPVNSYPNGASPAGALNMAGNVWELVEEVADPSQETKDRFKNELGYVPQANELWYAMRGGAFNFPWEELKIWDHAPIPAGWKLPNMGFRCVKDAQ